MIISHEGPHFGLKTTAESVRLSTDIDYVEVAEKVRRKMQRDFDAAVLAQCETELASFGYVKVMRCGDCEYQGNPRKCWLGETKPDEFCSRGKRKECGDE